MYSSQFLSLEVQKEGVAGWVPSEGVRENLLHALFLASSSNTTHILGLVDSFLPVSSYSLHSVCFCAQISPLYKVTSHIGLPPP